MTNQTKLKELKLKDRRKNSLVIGSIIATLIAVTPYIFYSYESVPDEKIWNTFLFTYKSSYYESALTAAWTAMGKILPLYLLLVWFFTCRHWWYHVLIIPIAMYSFQLGNVLNDDLQYVDQYQFIYLIPLMAIVIPSIYLIRAKMFNRITTKSMQQLEDEFRLGRKSFKDFF